MITAFSGITGNERNAMANIAHDAIQAAITNCYDLQKVADEFSGGDLADAFIICFKKGLQEYVMMMDMSAEEEKEKVCFICGHLTSEHKDTPFGPICPKEVKHAAKN